MREKFSETGLKKAKVRASVLTTGKKRESVAEKPASTSAAVSTPVVKSPVASAASNGAGEAAPSAVSKIY